MSAPIFVPHPPSSVIFEHVVKLILETLIVIPSLVFISELASPLSVTPRVPYSDQLQAIDVSNIQDTVGVVEQDTCGSEPILLFALIILLHVRASN